MNITSIKKAEKIVKHQLEILWENPEQSGAVPPLMIWGHLESESLPSFETYARKMISDLSMLD